MFTFSYHRFPTPVGVRVFLASAMIACTTLNPFSSAHAIDFVDDFNGSTLDPAWTVGHPRTGADAYSVSGGAFIAPVPDSTDSNFYRSNTLLITATQSPAEWYVESTMRWTDTITTVNGNAGGNYSELNFFLGGNSYYQAYQVQIKNKGWLDTTTDNPGRFLNSVGRGDYSAGGGVSSGYRDPSETYSPLNYIESPPGSNNYIPDPAMPAQLNYTLRIEKVTSNIAIPGGTTDSVNAAGAISAANPGYVVRYDWAGGLIGAGATSTSNIFGVYTAGGQYNQSGGFTPNSDTSTGNGFSGGDNMGTMITTEYARLQAVGAGTTIGFNPNFASIPSGQPFEYQVGYFATNLVAAIPEPGTMSLLAFAGLGGGAFLRRRRKN
jgi:PEP-CTERM motif